MSTPEITLIVIYIVVSIIADYFIYKAGYIMAEVNYLKKLANSMKENNDILESYMKANKEEWNRLYLELGNTYKLQLEQFKSEYQAKTIKRLEKEYNIVFTDKPE